MAELRRRYWLDEHWRIVALGLAGLLLANVLLHVFVIRRTVAVSGDREAILAGRRADLAVLGRELDQLERTASKLACTRSDLDQVFTERLSAKSDRMIAILRELSQLGRDMRVDPGRLGFSHSKKAESGLVRFSTSFSFEAPYRVLHEFIERVEGSENFLFIEQIGLTGARAQGDNLRLQIRVATWFQDPSLAQLDATFQNAGATP